MTKIDAREVRNVIVRAMSPVFDGNDPDEYTCADAILTALAAKGYVIVPSEPTEGMLEGGRNATRFKIGDQIPRLSDLKAIYRAMLAARGE